MISLVRTHETRVFHPNLGNVWAYQFLHPSLANSEMGAHVLEKLWPDHLFF